MVGIIGYIGEEEAKPILLQGLKNLESMDYDSLGLATLSDRLFIAKSVGKLDGAIDDLLKEFEGNIGIAHTRRATHGHICVANAHPHTDCKNRVAIVHNGVIENHKELKEELLSRGHIFTSSTDSEVIAHLIEEGLKAGRSFIAACMDAFKRLQGCYACRRGGRRNHIRIGCISPPAMDSQDDLSAEQRCGRSLQKGAGVAQSYRRRGGIGLLKNILFTTAILFYYGASLL